MWRRPLIFECMHMLNIIRLALNCLRVFFGIIVRACANTRIRLGLDGMARLPNTAAKSIYNERDATAHVPMILGQTFDRSPALATFNCAVQRHQPDNIRPTQSNRANHSNVSHIINCDIKYATEHTWNINELPLIKSN